MQRAAKHGVGEPSGRDRQSGLLELAVKPVQMAARERLQAQAANKGNDPQPHHGLIRLFSIPLVVSPSVPDDTAVIADMQAVGVWLRSMQIYISESHASYFPLNLVAILAELRAALGVLAPAGVGTVTGWD